MVAPVAIAASSLSCSASHSYTKVGGSPSTGRDHDKALVGRRPHRGNRKYTKSRPDLSQSEPAGNLRAELRCTPNSVMRSAIDAQISARPGSGQRGYSERIRLPMARLRFRSVPPPINPGSARPCRSPSVRDRVLVHFRSWVPATDEPLSVDRADEVFKQLDAPLVDRDQVVEALPGSLQSAAAMAGAGIRTFSVCAWLGLRLWVLGCLAPPSTRARLAEAPRSRWQK